MTTMLITRIPGVQGLWSCHTSHQRPVEGIAVYKYPFHWACEVDGPWRPWLPSDGLPCRHIVAVLADLSEAITTTLYCRYCPWRGGSFSHLLTHYTAWHSNTSDT